MKLSQLPRLLACTSAALLTIHGFALPARADSPPTPQTGEQLAGTWLVEMEDQKGTIVITPTGQVYILNPMADGQLTALKIGRVVQKLSPTATLPINAKVISVAQQFAQQANRARQSEAKQYIGAINRSEQAFFLENDRFTNNLNELGVGIKPETDNYRYQVFLLRGLPVSRPEFATAVWSIATPKKPNLKSYSGVVWAGNASNGSDVLTSTILCESEQPTANMPARPTFRLGQDQLQGSCPKGFSPLK